jgi:hypothetical protein
VSDGLVRQHPRVLIGVGIMVALLSFLLPSACGQQAARFGGRNGAQNTWMGLLLKDEARSSVDAKFVLTAISRGSSRIRPRK